MVLSQFGAVSTKVRGCDDCCSGGVLGPVRFQLASSRLGRVLPWSLTTSE